MTSFVLTARRGRGACLEGEALVSREAIHFKMDVDPQSGVCIRKGHPLEGQKIAGKILVFDYGKGGVTNYPGIPALAEVGAAPAGLIYYATKPDLVHAAIGGGITIMDGFDRNPVDAIGTGDYVRMDPVARTVEVVKKGEPSSPKRASRKAPKAVSMRLTPEEEGMLAGKEGEAARWAMEFLVQEGSYWNAEDTAPVFSVHLGSNVIHVGYRDWAVRLVERLVGQRARLRVPTTTSPVSVDEDTWREIGMEEEAFEKQSQWNALLVRLGVVPINTTSPYLLGNVPRLGDHIAWGESNEEVFANAYLGARGNLLSYLGVLAHGITGRIPRYGFALDENRRANAVVEVQAPLDHETDWEALGYVTNQVLRRYDTVPAFVGLPTHRADFHTLKRLANTLSTANPWGSLGMFHVPGVTLEAPTLEKACGGRVPKERTVITQKEIQSVYDLYNYEGPVNHVWIGDSATPWELAEIAAQFAGKKVAKGVNVWVFTDHSWKPVAERMGTLQVLRDAGCRIIAGMFPGSFGGSKVRQGLNGSVIVTDREPVAYWFSGSVSWTGKLQVTPVFRPVADCVRAAITGRL